jgi:hypothetical protein
MTKDCMSRPGHISFMRILTYANIIHNLINQNAAC